MRQAFLASSLLLAACSAPPAPAAAQPVDASAQTAETGSMRRLFTVDSVTAVCTGGKLALQVGATANSGGWGTPVLRRLGLERGALSYEVVANGPDGVSVTMMLQMFMLTHEEADARGVTSVRIVAATNEMSSKVSGCAS